jgi:hypothetical protein
MRPCRRRHLVACVAAALLAPAAAGATAGAAPAAKAAAPAVIPATNRNLTGLWTSDSTTASGPWTDRYVLTKDVGVRSIAVRCVYGGVPASCSNNSGGGGGGGGWHTAKISITGTSLAITFDFGLTHHGMLSHGPLSHLFVHLFILP